MTDPAVAYIPGGNYGTFNRGQEKDVFLKNASGGLSLGVVWPGESKGLICLTETHRPQVSLFFRIGSTQISKSKHVIFFFGCG